MKQGQPAGTRRNIAPRRTSARLLGAGHSVLFSRTRLERNKIAPRHTLLQRCPGESRGPPFQRSEGGSVDPGLGRESALVAVSSPAGRQRRWGTTMKSHLRFLLAFALTAVVGLVPGTQAVAQTDPLPAWNDGPA